MKILVIFTGGTIGSVINSEGKIATAAAPKYALIDEYERQNGHAETFDTVEPYRILSENLQAENLCSLVNCVKDNLNYGYDGIIITHGTDTLQYSAAILQYVFGNAGIPIILVGSDYVLSDSRACGHANFKAAVDLIRLKACGVFVAYRNNPGEPTYIHLGTRLQNGLTLSAAVSSICGSEYGSFMDDVFTPNSAYKVSGEDIPCIFGKMPEAFKLNARPAIIRLRPYPGMTYPYIPEGTRLILSESYHCGTICIDDELKRFSERARVLGIPFYITGLTSLEAEYETVDMYRKLGITPLSDCAAIAQYCKAWIAVSNGLDLKEIMTHSVSGDHV